MSKATRKSINIVTKGALEHKVQLNYNAPQFYYISVTPVNKRNLTSPTMLALSQPLKPYAVNMGMSVDSQKKHAYLGAGIGNAFNCIPWDWAAGETPTYDQWYDGVNDARWGSDFNTDLLNFANANNARADVVLGLSSTLDEAEWYAKNLNPSAIFVWDEVLGDKTPSELLIFGTELVDWRNANHPNIRLVFWADIVYKDQSRPQSAQWRVALQSLQKLLISGFDSITQYSQTNDRVSKNANNPMKVPGFVEEKTLNSHPFNADNAGNLQLLNDYYNIKLPNDFLVLAYEYPNFKIDFTEVNTEDNVTPQFINQKMMGGYDIAKKCEIFLTRNAQVNSVVWQQIGNLIVGGNGREEPNGINYLVHKMVAPMFYQVGQVKKVCPITLQGMDGCSGVCIQNGSTYIMLINNQSDNAYSVPKVHIDGSGQNTSLNLDQHAALTWDGEIVNNYLSATTIEVPAHSTQTFTFQGKASS